MFITQVLYNHVQILL